MGTKADVLRERYERFGRGDIAGALDVWSDDFVWDGDDSGLPGSGLYEGKQAAVGVLQQAVGAFDTFALVIDEYIEEGDTVVALGHSEVTKGDQSASVQAVHIWTFRGDQICRFRAIVDTLKTARLLGVI